MITGRYNIAKWFEAKPDFPYWALYYRSSKAAGVPIARMREQEEVTKSEGIQDLDKHLSLLSRGTYSLTAMPGAKIKGRGSETVDFEIAEERTGVGSVYDGSTPQPAAVVQGFTQADVDRQIGSAVDAAMAKYKADVELENLKKELAQLKKEKQELEDSHEDPWNKIAGVLAPHLPGLMGITTPGVAGVPADVPTPAPPTNYLPLTTTTMDHNENIGQPQETVSLTPEQQEHLSETLGIMAEIDPAYWLMTLRRLAVKGKAQPSLLTMLKSML